MKAYRVWVLLLAALLQIFFCGRLNAQQSSTDQASKTTRSAADLSRDEFSGRTVSSFEMVQKMIHHRINNAPRTGDAAPDFSLRTAEGSQVVRLKELHKEKPVVLIFSSWGCETFRESLPGLVKIHDRFKEKVKFVMIYVREAHPLDGWGAALGRVKDPMTLEARMATARLCKAKLKLPFPLLVDSMRDPVSTRWGAWPTRVFVVGTDGKVLYAGGQGPWGYRPYNGFEIDGGWRMDTDKMYNMGTLEDFLAENFSNKGK